MKKISLKDLKNGLKRDEMRSIQGGGCGGGADYLASWKCCNGNGCGTCSSSTGIPTCSTGYTLHACK